MTATVTTELWPDLDVEDRRQEAGGVVRNVTRPTLTRVGDGDGPAVVVAPGGGMHLLSVETEGRGPARLREPLSVTTSGAPMSLPPSLFPPLA